MWPGFAVLCIYCTNTWLPRDIFCFISLDWIFVEANFLREKEAVNFSFSSKGSKSLLPLLELFWTFESTKDFKGLPNYFKLGNSLSSFI